MKFSPEFNAKLIKARSLSASGNYEQAEALYKDLLSYRAESESLVRELVYLYLKSQHPEKAVDCFAKLVQLSPENWNYYISGAGLCEKIGRFDKGIEFYRELLKLKPDLPNTQYNLARLLKQAGRYQEAIVEYRKALTCGISDPEEVYSNLAVIYSELHKEEEALAQLYQALRINPNYIPAIFNLAAIFEESGNRDQAIGEYKKILEMDARYYPALCRIVHMQRILDEKDPLVARIKQALSDQTIDNDVKEELYFALGKALDDCGSYDDAFRSYGRGNELGRRRFSPYDAESQEHKVNTIIRQYSQEWFSRLSAHSKKEPVFVCGMFRSGSTLVEQILSGHSQVTPGGELEFFPDLVDNLSSAYPSCVFEHDGEWFENIAEAYCVFLDERFDTSNLVIDKRLDNFLHVGLIKSVFPESKIIWTRRNLLDNCLSIYFQQLGGNMNYSVNLEFIGHYYQLHVRLMEHWKSIFPSNVFELSYEELVKSPRCQTERLLKFLDLGWEETCLEFSSRKNYVKTASVWQVRQSIHRRSLGRHKKYAKYLGSLNKYTM